MALTDEIHDSKSPVSQFLRRQFPWTREVRGDWREQVAGAPTIRPGGPAPWGIIGAAIDYRVRFYFPGMDPKFTVAWLPSPNPQGDPDRSHPVFEQLQHFIDSARPAGRLLNAGDESILNRWCFVLAHLDMARRLGRYPATFVVPDPADWPETWSRDSAPLLGLADNAWIDDLSALSRLFFQRCSNILALPTVLGPGFGGGADGDLIVDGCLIEIKAMIDPEPYNQYIYQLLGYTLLDSSDRYRIQQVGIYLARQGILLKWPLKVFMDSLAGGTHRPLPELRAEFKAIAAESM
jgi:hypothetical protein